MFVFFWPFFFFFFFFDETATTEIYTLSLHDALPASCPGRADQTGRAGGCHKNLGPGRQIVSQDNPSGVSRIGGQAGTQAPDPTPAPPQNRGSRAGSTTHTLPAGPEALPTLSLPNRPGRRGAPPG